MKQRHTKLCAAFLGAFVSLCLCVESSAQTARAVEIDYTLNLRNPSSHLYDVEMSIKGIRETSVSVSMPAWSPGMYRIDIYARNVQYYRASGNRNQPLKL